MTNIELSSLTPKHRVVLAPKDGTTVENGLYLDDWGNLSLLRNNYLRGVIRTASGKPGDMAPSVVAVIDPRKRSLLSPRRAWWWP